MGAARAELIGLSYSPWTEKARWALDHHLRPYHFHEHLLLFGMPALRLRTRRFWGPLTVPAYCEGKTVWLDSWEIARHADAQGGSETLFPETDLKKIEEFNRLSEEALDAFRGLLTIRMARDPEACTEALPGFIPSALRRPMRGLAKIGIGYVRREFEIQGISEADFEKRFKTVLTELRSTLKKGRGEYLLGDRFSYADIALAVVLRGVTPPAKALAEMGPATRKVWTMPDLAKEFNELLTWRDGLYARHRRPSSEGKMK